jgi:DNA polymerase III delta prime subunit
MRKVEIADTSLTYKLIERIYAYIDLPEDVKDNMLDAIKKEFVQYEIQLLEQMAKYGAESGEKEFSIKYKNWDFAKHLFTGNGFID